MLVTKNKTYDKFYTPVGNISFNDLRYIKAKNKMEALEKGKTIYGDKLRTVKIYRGIL